MLESGKFYEKKVRTIGQDKIRVVRGNTIDKKWLEQRFEGDEGSGGVGQVSTRTRTFKTEWASSSKFLRRKWAWHVWRILSRLVWLERSEVRGGLIEDEVREEKTVRSGRALWAIRRTLAFTLSKWGPWSLIGRETSPRLRGSHAPSGGCRENRPKVGKGKKARGKQGDSLWDYFHNPG